MKVMEINKINQVIQERTKDWEDIEKEDREKIVDVSISFLNFAKQQEIIFDTSAGVTFITHLATLYYRLKNKEGGIEIDEEMWGQIPDEIQGMKLDFQRIIQEQLNQEIDGNEVFLIATHFGSMLERIKTGTTD